MSVEATLFKDGCYEEFTTDAAYVSGQVVQMPSGKAGVICEDVASGVVAAAAIKGIFTVLKTASMVMLPGSKLFWDFSANKAHLLHGGDRDFFLGHVAEEAASADTTVKVKLNEEPTYTVSLEDGFVSVKVETAGFVGYGGAGKRGFVAALSTTAEAQKVDAMSLRSVSTIGLGEAIVDALICINDNGNAAALDVNIGVASGTHATDFDSVTQALVAHFDGNDLNINLASRDGTTTVASTDTTTDFAEGTPFLVQWDCRNLADIQVYVNGVLQLASTVFKMDAAAGPLKFIAHMEKSADATPGNITLLDGGIRTAQAI